MIITCENCDSNFRVPKDAIGKNGRFVKCSNCDHEWLVLPEKSQEREKVEEEAVSQNAEPQQNQVNESESTEANEKVEAEAESEDSTPEFNLDDKNKKPPKRYIAPKTPIYELPLYRYSAYLVALALILMFGFQFFVNARINLSQNIAYVKNIYDFFGMYDTAGLVLDKVDCTISQIRSSKDTGENIEIEVDVFIKNTTDTPKIFNNIRFTLYDLERNYIGELIMPTGNTIEPNESYHIEGILNRVPKDSYYVAIDYGNYLDIVYRNIELLHEY